MNPPRRIAVALSVLAATATVLAGCSTPSGPAEPTTTAGTTAQTGERAGSEHNSADTMFAQMMILHHEGAIDMADLAMANTKDNDVRALAERIAAAQEPEIQQMQSWLEAWGEPREAGGHQGHGGMDMDGVSQEEMMAKLEGLSGAEFDEAFLNGMIAHHQGAVQMSETQLRDGENAEALALAEKIIEDQQAEIAEMEGLLER